MKTYWLLSGLLAFTSYAEAQFKSVAPQAIKMNYSSSELAYLNGKQEYFAGLRADPQLNYRYPSPWTTIWPSTSASGQPYWLGSTTTQSFNHGKYGTIYYYDQLGNMRYASPFIDIAGKNKRGLKLLLPTLNQRMFSSH